MIFFLVWEPHWVTLGGYSWVCAQKSLLSWGEDMGYQGIEPRLSLGQMYARQTLFHSTTAPAFFYDLLSKNKSAKVHKYCSKYVQVWSWATHYISHRSNNRCLYYILYISYIKVGIKTVPPTYFLWIKYLCLVFLFPKKLVFFVLGAQRGD